MDVEKMSVKMLLKCPYTFEIHFSSHSLRQASYNFYDFKYFQKFPLEEKEVDNQTLGASCVQEKLQTSADKNTHFPNIFQKLSEEIMWRDVESNGRIFWFQKIPKKVEDP